MAIKSVQTEAGSCSSRYGTILVGGGPFQRAQARHKYIERIHCCTQQARPGFFEVCCLGMMPTPHLIVGGQHVKDEGPRTMRVHIIGHIIPLIGHIGAHFVKRTGRNQMTFPINLPRNGRVRRTQVVVHGRPGRTSGINGHIGSKPINAIDNHPAHQIRILVIYI